MTITYRGRQRPGSPELSRVILGPVRHNGHAIRLRPPRMSDFAAWREIRLRDRAHIEPFWSTSPVPWERRHTARRWARECLLARADMRAGRRYASAIEVDGQFAGQLEFCVIDAATGTAESSAWIDARLAGHGVLTVAGAMLLDFGVTALGLVRVIAPISPANLAAAGLVRALGFRKEATMASAFDAGGSLCDHALWAWSPQDGTTTAAVAIELQTEAPAADRHARADSPAPMIIAIAALRLALWVLVRRLRRYTLARAVPITVTDAPNISVRGLSRADRDDWQAAAAAHGARLAPADRSRRRPEWHRALRDARHGMRSPAGLVLVLLAGERYAGEIRLFEPTMAGRVARLAAWADPELVDAAQLSAALRAVAEYGFGALGLRRIAAEADCADPVSNAALAAADFAEEGVLHDHCGPTGVRADHRLWATTTPPHSHRGRH
ncbi:GNAT family N-acetyltransferase [Nocardia alba]|uniref:Ribosomal-protein-alanine N-acetyltransferase n=1 Tax=Nocardia alba TaxID=225051 RepID=A0A4R1FSQ4_9NOCA|nr:GNAT family protein [Nocardia alba]TCJ97240.1 ribosomal-protein-alanine N-acetyltransferase [Nocardia alba]